MLKMRRMLALAGSCPCVDCEEISCSILLPAGGFSGSVMLSLHDHKCVFMVIGISVQIRTAAVG